MKMIFALLAVSSLSACVATGTQMQAACEAKYSEFPKIFQCTYDSVVQQNPKILADSRAKLYLLKGEQLALAVLQDRMSSLDAKFEWQKMYVDLRAAKKQELDLSVIATSQAIQAARAAKPAEQRTTNCTSNMLGSTMYTTCNK